MNVLTAIFSALDRFFRFASNLVSSWGPFLAAAVVFVIHQTGVAVGFAYGAIQYVTAKAEEFSADASSIQDLGVSQTIETLFVAANTFLPIDFMFSAIVTYGSLYVAAALIRFVVAVIPTVG